MATGEFSGDPSALWLTEEGTEDRQMKLLAGMKPLSATAAARIGLMPAA